MLKLKLYFGHQMQRTDSLKKTLLLGKIEGRRRRGWQRTKWLDGIIDSIYMSLSKLQEIVKDKGGWLAAVHGVAKSRPWLSDWTTTFFSKSGKASFPWSGREAVSSVKYQRKLPSYIHSHVAWETSVFKHSSVTLNTIWDALSMKGTWELSTPGTVNPHFPAHANWVVDSNWHR